MKKILAFTMVVLMLISAGAVSAYAKISINQYWEQTLFQLEDDETVYSMIRYTASDSIKAYEFSAWVEKMGLLQNVADYTEEYGEKLISDYHEYIKAKRTALLEDGEAFFEKYFDASTDELVCNSDRRALVLIKSTVAKAKSLEDKEDCTLFFASDRREYSITRFDDNNDSYLNPTDDYILNMEPYELVYSLHFFKENWSSRDEDLLKWNRYDYFYQLLYRHYDSTNDEATLEEATPDYVLVFAGNNSVSPAYSAANFGDKYLVQEYNIYYPYLLGMHIITTEDMKVYTLREAWDAQIDGIEDVFTDYGLGEIRGDSDLDGKITVKDVTYVQKCLAGIQQFTESDYVSGFGEPGQADKEGMFFDRVSDMNMDGKVNIKDATAIQKFLAGLPY